MQFDKLRLIGFKSFVEPTDIAIEPGLTGVVGPNGCGKSNLVEALRWVMGEASYRSVRGSSMDDVIFAGSGRRAMRDTAEVTLVLDNASRSAPAELNTADTLEVTRKIDRGVGSDYRVNGRAVRARDVQLLFADAATGSRSPSMVRQGQVAELIAAKPTERRNILEEAAGISGLRARKHEATLKLNAAEQNLSRADDVAEEVTRQMEGLKRQARQARRYRTVAEEIRTLEATVHHVRWVEAGAHERTAEATLREARAANSEAASQQQRAAIVEAAARHALPELREAAQSAGEARQTIASELAALDARDAQAASRLAALKAQCEALERDLSRQSETQRDAAATLERLQREEADLGKAESGAEDRLARLQAEAQRLADAADVADREASAASEAAATVLAANSAAKAALEKAEREATSAAGEVERLADALAAAQASDAVRARHHAIERLKAAEGAEAAAVDAAAAAEAEVAPAVDAETSAQQEARRLTAERAERETEARALERLTQMLAPRDDALLEACSVESGYEAAFAAALGDDLQAPVSDSEPVRWLPDARVRSSEPSPAVPRPLPADVQPLADHVRAPASLAARLAHTGIVASVDGHRLQGALEPGQRLVSREGALWRWDGFCRDEGATSAAAERLAHKNRLAVLEAELEGIGPLQDAALAAATAARATLLEATRAEAGARDELHKARRATGEARTELARAEANARRAEDEAHRLAAAHEVALAQREATAQALSEARAHFEECQGGTDVAVARDRALGAASAARRSAAEAAQAVDAERRTSFGRRRRLERIAAELADWRHRLEGSDGHREELAARLAATSEERDRLAEAPSQSAEERRELARRLQRAKAEAEQAASILARAEAHERAATEAARAALDALAASREAVGRAEERHAAAVSRIAEIRHDLTEALGVAPEAAARLAGLDPADPLPERAGCEARLEKLKVERERIGSVNLCAEDELAEIEARHGKMAAERDDLIAGIDTLRQGISRLNKEARGKLLASFEIVDANFQRLFTHLFGGGEASLQLTEAEDPLDAGLEIIARPPGKKPQSLSLLSGGEQTLTATALIFAVFLTNPAPISVLDEIDAPLDDANVERFCALLDEMVRSTATRFMIITHNPITMSRMHRLYGVTMVEKGVSQLVSVNLQAAEELRESESTAA